MGRSQESIVRLFARPVHYDFHRGGRRNVGLLIRRPLRHTSVMLIGLVDLLPYLGVGAAMIPWISTPSFTAT